MPAEPAAPQAGYAPCAVIRRTPDGAEPGERTVAAETPIAFEYNGLGYAVMMATPADLTDFAVGFSLTEGLAAAASDIIHIEPVRAERGWLLRIELAPSLAAPIFERARRRLADSGCGLCAIENLEKAVRPLPPIEARPLATAASIFAALDRLPAHQQLNRKTGGVHAAAWCDADGAPRLVREDVGRHNALDKLIGAMARDGDVDRREGFVLLTSRCSYELVDKAIMARLPMLVTVSAPTTLAIERARAHGLTLVGLARPDALLVLHDPHGLFDGGPWSRARADHDPEPVLRGSSRGGPAH